MDAQGYVAKMKKIQDTLLEFLDNDNDFDNDLQQFTTFLSDQNIQGEILKDFLNMLSTMSNNRQRAPNFIKKVESILAFLKKDILSKFANTSLFNIFRENKRILLFLFKEKFIQVDEYIHNFLVKKDKNIDYFSPELIFYMTNETKVVEEDEESFEENRRIGENHNYLCKLIRNDSIEEFITYVNKINLPLKTANIPSSYFETNRLLLSYKELSLMEYAAFFGSIQTIRYLQANDAELTSLLWRFAVHSNNPDLIHFLESNVSPKRHEYEEYFEEAVKCYNYNIAEYIKENYLLNSNEEEESTNYDSLKLIEFYNFDYFPNDLGNEKVFNYLCKYDYLYLANIIMKGLDINKETDGIFKLITL